MFNVYLILYKENTGNITSQTTWNKTKNLNNITLFINQLLGVRKQIFLTHFTSCFYTGWAMPSFCFSLFASWGCCLLPFFSKEAFFHTNCDPLSLCATQVEGWPPTGVLTPYGSSHSGTFQVQYRVLYADCTDEISIFRCV